MRASGFGWLGVVGLSLVSGCKSETAVEGANPGECADGADNDVDGFFDCDDNNCWSAPDCDDGNGNGKDTDTDDGTTDAGTDTDTDLPIDVEGSGFIDFLHSFSMTYRVTFEPDGLLAALCDVYLKIPDCNCEALYSGSGVLVAADGPSATYEGTFKLEGSSCYPLESKDPNSTFNDKTIWRPSQTNAEFLGQEFHAFHTFQVKSSLKGIVDWVVHEDEANLKRMPQAMANQQFWIWLTESHTWDNTTWELDYQESETKYIDITSIRNLSKVKWAFSESDTPPVLPLFDIPQEPDPIVDTDTDTDGIFP